MKWMELLPKNTFLYEYIKYCDNLETATDFDFWSGVWCLSMLCNRNIQILRPNSPLFMNFYITLIAESGIARKSTAVNLAKDIVSFSTDEEKDKIQLVNSTTSASKFNFILTKSSYKYDKCVIGLTCPEFITFFKNKSVIECFTDLYDCPDERKGYGTFTNGEIDIRNVFVSTLSASTPNYYFKAIGEEEIEGGFTSRNIIVYANKGKRKIAWAKESNKTKLQTEFRKVKEFIPKQFTTIELTSSAIRRYSSWYERRRLSTDLYSRSFEAREQDFVLKLAGILAINEGFLSINENHISTAIKIINYQKKIAQKFFNDEVYTEEKSSIEKTIEKIREIIHSKSTNGIGHRELYLRVHNSCTNDEFNYIINIMHELGLIEKLQIYNSKQIIYREASNMYKVPIAKLVGKIQDIVI